MLVSYVDNSYLQNYDFSCNLQTSFSQVFSYCRGECVFSSQFSVITTPFFPHILRYLWIWLFYTMVMMITIETKYATLFLSTHQFYHLFYHLFYLLDLSSSPVYLLLSTKLLLSIILIIFVYYLYIIIIRSW